MENFNSVKIIDVFKDAKILLLLRFRKVTRYLCMVKNNLILIFLVWLVGNKHSIIFVQFAKQTLNTNILVSIVIKRSTKSYRCSRAASSGQIEPIKLKSKSCLSKKCFIKLKISLIC